MIIERAPDRTSVDAQTLPGSPDMLETRCDVDPVAIRASPHEKSQAGMIGGLVQSVV
jgi:hypothetical protein